MLGNLSKILFKAPGLFNNSLEQKEILNNNREGYTLNSFNTININDNKLNSLYFREKDFWKKNYEPEINFNHNKRISFYLIKSPKRHLTINTDSNANANTINLNKRRFNTVNKKKKYPYLLTDIREKLNLNINNNFSAYKNNNIFHKKNIFENIRLKTEANEDVVIKDRYINLFDKKSTFKNNTIKSDKISTINNIFKSQEILFQDNVDNKFRSLILVKPEIKEQLKEKNRSMVGKRDYYKYLNYRRKINNPFYETIKMKEEMNNC